MLTRALVTFAFGLFCVASALVFGLAAASLTWFWPLGILLLFGALLAFPL